MRKRSIIIILALVFVFQYSTVFAADNINKNNVVEVEEDIQLKMTGEITGNGVRLRKTASKTGTVLGLLYKGDRVNVVDLVSNSQGKWAYVITSKGIAGYVSADYVAL